MSCLGTGILLLLHVLPASAPYKAGQIVASPLNKPSHFSCSDIDETAMMNLSPKLATSEP